MQNHLIYQVFIILDALVQSPHGELARRLPTQGFTVALSSNLLTELISERVLSIEA